MSEKDKKTNRVNLRISDKTVLDLLTDLYASPLFPTKTEVINRALALGVSELYSDTFGKKKTSVKASEIAVADSADSDMKGMRITLDQNAVTLNICEKLLTVLYNLEASKADGIELNPELFTSGILDQLPKHLYDEKQAMIKAEFMRRKK
jgi:hypothetical protein